MVWRCCIARRALSSHHHKGRPLCRQRHRLDCLRRLKGEKERKKDGYLVKTTFFFLFSDPSFFNIHISIRYTAVRLCLCRRLLKKTRSGSPKGKGGPSPNTEHTILQPLNTTNFMPARLHSLHKWLRRVPNTPHAKARRVPSDFMRAWGQPCAVKSVVRILQVVSLYLLRRSSKTSN